MCKSGFGSYKKNSASSVGFKTSLDNFASIYASVLSIAGPDLIFFGFPETATIANGKVSKWTSFSNLLTSSSPLYLDQVTDAARPALNSSTSRPFQNFGNASGTYLTTRTTQGTFGNVNMTSVTDMTVCTYLDLNNVDGAAVYPILFETGLGGFGGAYVNTLGALELQIVFPTTVASGKIEFDLKRGHTSNHYQIASYLVDNTNNYLRTGFNHFTFYWKAAKDNGTGNTFEFSINNVTQTLTVFSSPAAPGTATSVTNFNNIPIHWGSSYGFSTITADYSSLIIIGRKLTTDERTKIYNIQRAIGDVLQ